jgi:hypothetical protein
MSDSRVIIRGEVKDETTMNTHDQKARANALFEGEKQQKGREAITEYQAQQTAVREKTERLRALRLARDAAEATMPVAADVEVESPIKAKAANGDAPHVRLHRVKGRRLPKGR